ncbi:hypothetical protein ACFL6S_14065 [Candidatus Poribacteria bacterium]
MDAIEKNLMRLPRKPVAPDLASRINQRIHEERRLFSYTAISAMSQIQNRQWAVEQKPQPVQKKQPLPETRFDFPMPRQISRPPRRVASGTVYNILWATRDTTIDERRNQCPL